MYRGSSSQCPIERVEDQHRDAFANARRGDGPSNHASHNGSVGIVYNDTKCAIATGQTLNNNPVAPRLAYRKDDAPIADVEDVRNIRAACIWSAGLVALFFTTYIFAAWVTSQRHSVPSIVFEWERRIPFIDWTIVPYWSTDFLFVYAPFLFRSRAGMAIHGKRIIAVQLVSILGFLLYPLQFSFDRPPVNGVFHWMYALRTGFDVQFNAAPSLHVGFTIVLWSAYGRYLRGGARWFAGGWFVLTILSTMTTYRHHLIDVLTGVPVGLLCVALIPTETTATATSLESRKSRGTACCKGSAKGTPAVL